MKKFPSRLFIVFWTIISFISPLDSIGQITPIGSGSYTLTHPGVDAAGRNGVPPGSPQVSENALSKPVPTNDWWSTLIQSDHASNLFNYPLSMKTVNEGLVMSYISWGVFDDLQPVVIGVDGLNSSNATVADHSDWTVTIDWNDGTHHFQATSGIGMPFVYFNKKDSDVASVTINHGTVTVNDEMIIVENAREGADFVIYAPTGSTWVQNGETYTSTLNNNNYWSAIMLPQSTTDVTAEATYFKQYAYVFPSNTIVSWDYNEATSVLTTDFTVTTDIKEGSETNMVLGILPHQWSNLSSSSTQPSDISYTSVRGELKTILGTSFQVENTFHGILPTLPYVNNQSEGFDISSLNEKVTALENESLATWTDSYNEGQAMNRLIQTARIADEIGNNSVRDKLIAVIKERLEDWLTAEEGEVAFLFHYSSTWTALLGYPAGHGQDTNLNDHHFHWGYFIHAAAFLEQYEPGWADQYGDMVNLLVRDASSPNHNDDTFPFLRNFSPYAGHCWANGFASFPQGNDQESTSESMQFHSSLIHWGSVTGNDEIRDLGIYLYTTEQTAVEEYWFDMYERNFKDDQQYSLVSRVWSNSYDNGTFWTADIAASYNIELYPLHGGALYLGHNTEYVDKLWAEMTANTGVLDKVDNANLWYDVMWGYLSFSDPQKALELYNDYTDRPLKFGVSDAHTYYWLHSMNALGQIETGITANSPMAVAFNNEGDITYVGHNYTDTESIVTFSNGFELTIPAHKTVTNKDVNIESLLTSSFEKASTGGAIDLTLTIEEITPTKVEFFDNGNLIEEITSAPFIVKADKLTAGQHRFYAKIYNGEAIDVSNVVTAVAGLQVPYNNQMNTIPGVIEAGKFDHFEGGVGQGITYFDVSTYNEGNFRSEEAIDNVLDDNEGATVGWTAGGEWMEYTVNIASSGLYNFSYRYASANGAGGGPFSLSIDGEKVTEDISVGSTGDWNGYQTQTIADVPLPEGEHILRVDFSGGEFNLGKLTFELSGDLPYSLPVANAGDDRVIDLSGDDIQLDASNSYDPDGANITFEWEQIYGPSTINFSSIITATPLLSNLEEGEYLVKLTVANDTYSNSDFIKIFATESGSMPPSITLTSPSNGASFYANSTITLSANASDMDGTVQTVEFFVNNESVGTATTSPFEYQWTTADVNTYNIYAVATDNEDNTSSTGEVSIQVSAPPSCEGTSNNGDYNYLLSDDKSNPTLTFVPNQNGMGESVCILFLSIDGGGYGGYNVTPNEPYQLNVSEGTAISYYYTYSHPEGGERNTLDNPHTYTVGTCIAPIVDNTIPTVSLTAPENGSSFVEGTEIQITADASDEDGTVASVTFYVNDQSIGAVTEAPYTIQYTVASGSNNIKAIVEDNDGKSSESTMKVIQGTSANACYEGEVSNGDFSFQFSTEDENPTLTFIPKVDGVGGQTLILYYSINGGGYPGYNATANQPFQLNAPANSSVSFYYTYSHPEGGERNTADDIQTFVLGSCDDVNSTDPAISLNGITNGSQFVLGSSISFSSEITNTEKTVTEVDYIVNGESVGKSNTAPYTLTWVSNLSGELPIKAIATFDDNSEIESSATTIQVGRILAFEDTPSVIPGVIEGGNYDKFEFGKGQNITYYDVSEYNEGNHRTDEYVDAVTDVTEGNTVGWIAGGEWLTYSINVTTTGVYTCSFRYASDNNVSRGPFYLEIDGQKISSDIQVHATGGWNTWEEGVINDINLTEGNHILKVYFIGGEFNLGKMNFELERQILPPTINVTTSNNLLVYTIGNTITINADASDEDGNVTSVEFFVDGNSIGSDEEAPFAIEYTPESTGNITVTAVATDNENATATSEELAITINEVVIPNVDPTVTIATSDEATEYTLGNTITINADTNDEDGNVASVEFFVDGNSIGSDEEAPFAIKYTPENTRNITVTAVATDNENATATSEELDITINEVVIPNVDPTVTIATSDEASEYTLGNTITINADANDEDGNITSVEFFVDGNSIGADDEAPFSIDYTPENTGNISVTAIATDNENATATSEELDITINEVVIPNVDPTVTITTSDEATEYTLGNTITINADANDEDGNITSVEFFVDGNSIGSDEEAPFSVEYTPESTGNISVTAVATDNENAATTSEELAITINEVVIPNVDPTVTIATSDEATEYTLGNTITINADANDEDGNIVSVEFFVDGNSVGSDEEAPFSVDYTPENTGSITVTAVATDNENATTTSEELAITINEVVIPNVDPTITIATSDEASEYTLGNTITINADASDEDGNITSVEFFVDGNSIGSDEEAPFAIEYTPESTGNITITAVATDNENATATSEELAITINEVVIPNVDPTVTIATSDEATEYTLGNTITINADASDENGNVASVEFFVDGNSIGSDEEAPFSMEYTPESTGNITVTAVATDNENATATSEELAITINEVVIPNVDPTVTIATSDESTEYTIGNTITINADANDEDGNVASVEFFVDGNSIGADDEAPFSMEYTPESTGNISVTAIATDNENAATTSEELAITINEVVIPNVDPTVTIATSNEASEYTLGNTITINADASDEDGNITSVEFFVDGNSIGSDEEAPFAIEYTPENTGNITVTAVATDNENATTTSEELVIAIIEVVIPNVDPTVTIATSDEASEYTLGNTITINADASDEDGNITSVEFFVDGNSIGADEEAPFSIEYTPESTGNISVTAIATDNENAATTSEELAITIIEVVIPNVDPTVTIATSDEAIEYTLGNTITINANANDEDGNIAYVEFFVDGNSIGADEEAPFAIEYTPESTGNITVTAVATDNENATATSEELAITIIEVVIPNVDPTVTIATSDEATEYTLGNTITINADANDEDGNVASVEFFVDGNSIGSDEEAPFAIEYTPESTGNISVTAVATDNENAATTSEELAITIIEVVIPNVDPTVTIATSDEATEYTLGNTITINANASDEDGNVAYVEFFVDGNSIGADDEAPFSIDYTPESTGNISVTAVATDNENATATSEELAITIIEVVIPNVDPTITIATSDEATEYTLGNTITINADANDEDGNIASVEFFVDGNSIGSDEEAPFSIDYTPESTGNISVTAVATDNENATAISNEVIILIIEDDVTSVSNINNVIKFYPNPVENTITLELIEANNEIKIFNLNGKSIYSISTINKTPTIDLSNLQTGIYFMEVIGSQSSQRIKIIKK